MILILPGPFITNSVETRFGHDFFFLFSSKSGRDWDSVKAKTNRFFSQNNLNAMCDKKWSLIQIVNCNCMILSKLILHSK